MRDDMNLKPAMPDTPTLFPLVLNNNHQQIPTHPQKTYIWSIVEFVAIKVDIKRMNE